MKKCIYLIMITSICFGVLSSQSYGDTVVLKDGSKITGIIVQERDNQIRIQETIGSGVMTHTVMRINIEKIERDIDQNTQLAAKRKAELEKQKEQEIAITETVEEKMEDQNKERAKKKAERVAEEVVEKHKKKEGEESENLRKENKAYRILDDNVSVSDGIRYYRGQFENTGKKLKTFVKITGKFYDENRKLLKTDYVYTSPPEVEPGTKASYTIKVNESVPVVYYEIEPSWEYK